MEMAMQQMIVKLERELESIPVINNTTQQSIDRIRLIHLIGDAKKLLKLEKENLEYTFTAAKSIGYNHSNISLDEFLNKHFNL